MSWIEIRRKILSTGLPADIEKALDACEAKSEGQSSAAIENGKDYRCYMETAVNIPSRLEVLE